MNEFSPNGAMVPSTTGNSVTVAEHRAASLSAAVRQFNETFGYRMELPIERHFFDSMMEIARARGRGDIAEALRAALEPCKCEMCVDFEERRDIAAIGS